MPDRVLVASAMTVRPERCDNSHGIAVDVDPTTGYLTFETIRSVVWAAPPGELQALERLWLFARGVILGDDDFLPKRIDVERGRSDVARAWLKCDAVRRRPRVSGLPTITTREEVPA